MSFVDDLKLSQSGDRKALQKLLFGMFPQLSDYVAKKTPVHLRSKLDVDGIVQESLLQAMQKIGDFRSTSELAFESWLKKIALSRVVDHLRAETSRKRGGGNVSNESDWFCNDESIAVFLDQISDPADSPSLLVSKEERIEVLKRQMQQLPEHYRQAIFFRHIQQLSRQEAAKEMNRSEDEFRGILNRALQKLREALGDASLFRSFS